MPGVELATLPIGVLWYETAGGVLAPAAGASVYIYQHVVPPATPSVQIQIYSDEGLTIPISQPLTADSQGALPGYIDAPASGDVGKIFDVVPTFNSVTLSPQMGNAVRGDTAMSGGGGGGSPTGPALGVNVITGPTGAIAASTTTNFTITIPSWAEGTFDRVVIGLSINHPDASNLAATLADAVPRTSTLFVAGTFASSQTLGPYDSGASWPVIVGGTDPDSFVYFSDEAEPDLLATATLGLNLPNFDSRGLYNNILVPNSPLATLNFDTTSNLTLAITETGGSTGTLEGVFVFLISSEFDAIRGSIPAVPKPTAINVLDHGVKNDGQAFRDGHVNGTTTFTTTSAHFTPADVGKTIAISQALSTSLDKNTLVTTIAAYVSPTQVTLNAAADQTLTPVDYVYGTDNTSTIAALIPSTTTPIAGSYYFPSGIYIHRGCSISNAEVFGDGNGTVLLFVATTGPSITLHPAYNNQTQSVILRDLQVGMVWDFNNRLSSPSAPAVGFGGVKLNGGGPVTIRNVTNSFTQFQCVAMPYTSFWVGTGSGGPFFVEDCVIYGQGPEIEIDGGFGTFADCYIRNFDWLTGAGTDPDIKINYTNVTGGGQFMLRNLDGSATNTSGGVSIVSTGAQWPVTVRDSLLSNLSVAAGFSNFHIINNKFLTSGTVTVASGSSDHYSILGNDCNGTAVSDGGSGTHKAVANNY
jgi:hypothetical protein